MNPSIEFIVHSLHADVGRNDVLIGIHVNEELYNWLYGKHQDFMPPCSMALGWQKEQKTINRNEVVDKSNVQHSYI